MLRAFNYSRSLPQSERNHAAWISSLWTFRLAEACPTLLSNGAVAAGVLLDEAAAFRCKKPWTLAQHNGSRPATLDCGQPQRFRLLSSMENGAKKALRLGNYWK